MNFAIWRFQQVLDKMNSTETIFMNQFIVSRTCLNVTTLTAAKDVCIHLSHHTVIGHWWGNLKKKYIFYFHCYYLPLGKQPYNLMQWICINRGLLRHCVTSRKVPGSIPGVAGDFFSVPSDSFMCPGVDSASKNEYQANPGGKGGRYVRLTTYHIHVPMSRNLGALTP
jgi:hypothetical protein